jgi:hypothetical protein
MTYVANKYLSNQLATQQAVLWVEIKSGRPKYILFDLSVAIDLP